ncbi:ATP-binding protein [Chitinibacter sp. GC72]|uniref:ATP-binding protein n=1 Tax=Chitinibacter sp. GC72 TaxID=1526917 RepID=UPI0012F9D9A4|nr:ATP-binding protein [Chitinibacter sp. GC72]
MISKISLNCFGPTESLCWTALGPINLIIGGNGSGKTFLLKAIYSSLRTLEEYKRGQEQRTAAEILADKLYWTFQQDKIGDLVRKGHSTLSFELELEQRAFSFSFGKDTTKQITTLENHVPPRAANSIFLPPKEVLSLQHVILKSREQDKDFGFDDTYYDLAKALTYGTSAGRNYNEFAKSRAALESILGGKIEFDPASQKWQFKNARNQKFQIGVTAEGIKKIAILDTLLGNRFLSPESVIFIDEPESALHPDAIERLMEIITVLAARGIQFFIASHSYFVIKKLYLLAQEQQMSIPVLSSVADQWKADDLLSGMPDNPIIEASIALYRKEMEITLG